MKQSFAICSTFTELQESISVTSTGCILWLKKWSFVVEQKYSLKKKHHGIGECVAQAEELNLLQALFST